MANELNERQQVVAERQSLASVELFGGAGGLALGTHLAGFDAKVFVEWNRWACDTVRENARNAHPAVRHTEVIEADARHVDLSHLAGTIDLVSGGPPCQPFSMGGKAAAAEDPRDMFPAAVEMVRQIKPSAFVFENVRGLTRTAFADYLELIRLRLTLPDMPPRPDESWVEHLARLRVEESRTEHHEVSYGVAINLVNAADFGVPQHRHRVFIVGFRNDIGAEWSMPQTTHSRAALVESQWVSGQYWDEHKIATKHRPDITPAEQAVAARIERGQAPTLPRWRTVRDALAGMPEPTRAGVTGWHNHFLQPGARSYPGHTGSPVDQPSKALKAGGHGVPGGENMLRMPDGAIRYYSIRESARIQTFPDDYILHGSWGEAMRQLGNAVPVELARAVASSLHTTLSTNRPR